MLASLTRLGHPAFRRLCVEFGAEVTVSPMVDCSRLLARDPQAIRLLEKHDSERAFGVQLATASPAEAVEAGRLAVDHGATFIDINAGCPAPEITDRGMGAVLLQHPELLARIVERLAVELPVPITVKLRTGWSESDHDYLPAALLSERSGAAAIALHGRSRPARFDGPCDWESIALLADTLTVPVIGNGDIFCWEHLKTARASGCVSTMVGRGALMRPWLFREAAECRTIDPDLEFRFAVHWRLARYLRDWLRGRTWCGASWVDVLGWHLAYFAEAEEGPLALLLRDDREAVRARVAKMISGADTPAEASSRLLEFAQSEHGQAPSSDHESGGSSRNRL